MKITVCDSGYTTHEFTGEVQGFCEDKDCHIHNMDGRLLAVFKNFNWFKKETEQ